MGSERIFEKNMTLQLAEVIKESAIWNHPFYGNQYRTIRLLEYIQPGDIIFVVEKHVLDCYVVSIKGVAGWVSANDIKFS